jgi:hypothetical protein
VNRVTGLLIAPTLILLGTLVAATFIQPPTPTTDAADAVQRGR